MFAEYVFMFAPKEAARSPLGERRSYSVHPVVFADVETVLHRRRRPDQVAALTSLSNLTETLPV